MYTEEDIASAIEAGIISEDTAAAFRTHVASLGRSPAVDEEHVRFVTGFNDIFVVIACALLMSSVAWLGAAVAPWVGAAGVAATAWGLAEFFTLKRRMALPSIVLLLAFVGGVMNVGLMLFETSPGSYGVAYLTAAVMAAFAALVHWLRFGVPITIAAGAAAVVGLIIVLLLSAVPEAKVWIEAAGFAAGLAVFLAAMAWDSKDTERNTRNSDVAFWLHLLAAPLIVHPIFWSLGVLEGGASVKQAVAVIALYMVLGLVSLWIDRRALMVSALVYVLYTFSELLEQFGFVSLSFAVTALVVGSGLLLLSAFWHASRAFAMKLVPRVLRKRLPSAK